MGYEDDNGVLNFAVMDGRRWGYLGLTHSFSVRSRHTPLFSLYILASRTLELDVVRRCRCCCADKTRVCHAAGAFFLYPSGEHRLGIFLFRTSNIEYIFSLRIETPHLLHILCPDYLVVPCLVFATTMLTPFPPFERKMPIQDWSVSKYSSCLDNQCLFRWKRKKNDGYRHGPPLSAPRSPAPAAHPAPPSARDTAPAPPSPASSHGSPPP